jgi:hypothetical protein
MTKSMGSEWEQSALLGELARPVMHEVNNFLNNLLLQIALIDPALPPPLRDDLAKLVRQGKDLARLTQQWQGRPRPDSAPTALDLDGLLRQICTDYGWNEVVDLRLDSGSTRVFGSEVAVRCLLVLLLTCVVETATGERPVVTTQASKLTVSQSELVAREGADLFEPTTVPRFGLHLAACKAMVQRLGGRARSEGSNIVVELPAAE